MDRLIARTFELGAGKSCIVILRGTPGASLIQSSIAALPVISLASPSPAFAAGALAENAEHTATKIAPRKTKVYS
jgi:hypothetical protein